MQNLLPSMFGTAGSEKLSLHASETDAFMRFSVTIIERYATKLDRAHLFAQAARSAVRVMDLIHLHPKVFPAPAIQDPSS